MHGPDAIQLGDRLDRVTDATDEVAARIDAGIDGAFRLASVILGSSIDAEDAVAEAALDAWRGRASLRDLGRFDAWFGRIVVNACRDRLRARRRHPVVALDPARIGADPSGEAFVDRLHASDALARALATLPPDDRIVVVLRFWSDLSVDAIAERLGVPAGTVKSRLSRALGRVRAALAVADER